MLMPLIMVDVFFTGWLYKLNTPEFKKVNRSQYATSTDFKQDIVDYIGNNCYIPTSGISFINCIIYFTKKVYTQEFLTYIRTEHRRSNVMTSARIQLFCRKSNINIGCFDEFRVYPRNITQRDIASKKHNNLSCLIWKSKNISFNQVIENELKPNFKVVDNVISDKHVKSCINYEYKPEKVQSQLTNIIVYNLETFNIDKAVPYASCIYRLSKISGKYNQDMTQREYEKCRKDCVVFKGTDSINKFLDYVLRFKGEVKKVKNKFFNYNLYLLVHKGPGFDSYIVLNKLPQCRTVVSLIKNGSGNLSLKIFNGYVDQAKKYLSMFILDAV